jgi:hypothetical protein
LVSLDREDKNSVSPSLIQDSRQESHAFVPVIYKLIFFVDLLRPANKTTSVATSILRVTIPDAI